MTLCECIVLPVKYIARLLDFNDKFFLATFSTVLFCKFQCRRPRKSWANFQGGEMLIALGGGLDSMLKKHSTGVVVGGLSRLHFKTLLI